MAKSRVGKALTRNRKGTHGPFDEVARITGGVTELFQSSRNWHKLSSVAKMALNEITHKQARILSGDHKHKDHWDDIGGYAQLGADDAVKGAIGVVKWRRPRVKKPAVVAKLTAAPKGQSEKIVERKRPAKKKVTARPAKKRAVAPKPARPSRAPRQRERPAPVVTEQPQAAE